MAGEWDPVETSNDWTPVSTSKFEGGITPTERADWETATTEASPLTSLGMGTRDVLQGLGGGLGVGPATERLLQKVGLPERPPSKTREAIRGAAGVLPSLLFGEFLPALGPLTSGVKAALTAAPGAQLAAGGAAGASEEAARELGVGPLGQMAAGLAGGLVGGKAATPSTRTAIPTTQELRQQADAAYDYADKVGAIFSQQGYGQLVSDIDQIAKDYPVNERLTPWAHEIVKRIRSLASSGNPVSLKEIDTERKIMNRALTKAPDDADRDLVRDLRDSLDNFIDSATPQHLVAGHESAVQALNNARQAYSRFAKSRDIERMTERAELSASSQATALRNEFRSLAKNERKMRRFSKDEQEAIKDFVKGGSTTKFLNFLGSMGSTGLRKLWSFGIGSTLGGGPLGGLAVLGGESGAQALANQIARKQTAKLAEMMRAGQKPPGYLRQFMDLSPSFLPGAVFGTMGAEGD